MCALKSLPKTYKFDARVVKGDFPFEFNTPENQDYIGPIPPIEAYGIAHMKPDAQAEIRAFYETVKDVTDFNLQHELRKYCWKDVEILLIAIQEFRKSFKSVAGFDSIEKYFTLPSMSYGAFRRDYLQPETIGLTPFNDYHPNRTHSVIADIWMDWLEHQDGNIIITREQKLGKYPVDGYDHNTETVYEFNGCLWHGCPRHYPDSRNTVIPPTKSTPNFLYGKTCRKREYFQRLKDTGIIPGLNYVEMWEGDFAEQILSNPELSAFVEQRKQYYQELEAVGTIKLRDAYFGGRTMNAHFYKKCDDSEKFDIVDFNSLYPSVIAKKDFMTGHPILIQKDFDQWIGSNCFKKPVFGLVKCKVLPPKRMAFPILPARYNDRLEFVLCNKCAETNASDFCNHPDEDRCLTGTFTSPELEVALQYGYRIVKVFEIMHWPGKSSELFSPFIRKLVKVKAEASGYPAECETEEQKDAYIEQYYQDSIVNGDPDTGIRLDKENIAYDPIKRQIAKIMLNAFYGKFAQRQNMEVTQIITSHARLWELILDTSKEITGMVALEENSLLVSSRLTDFEEDGKQGNINVAIASFITAYARLELWQKLNELESLSPGCVYYFDTDSIFYVSKDDYPLLQTGSLLGDLTREIAPNEVVKDAAFLGPKNYTYKKRNIETGQEKTVVKNKGMTLHADALNILTFERLFEMAKLYCEDGITTEEKIKQFRIHSAKNQIVTTITLNKVYRPVSEKRLIVGNDTYPKGYVKEDSNQYQGLNLDQFISMLEGWVQEANTE
jgi:hypothetical protein